MNKHLSKLFSITLILALMMSMLSVAQTAKAAPADDLVITGIIDGPLTGGIPKAVEFYVLNDIPDLSIYGFGSANNGGGTDGEEFTFPAVAATAGEYIYVATESTAFTSFFGFAPDYTDGSGPNINGDDAIELFTNGVVSDIFGDINIDGTGEPWDHVDGWAYRVSGTGPDGSTFVLANWTFSGTDALDFETTNAGAAVPFPIGTYGTPPPSSTDLLLTGVIDGPLTGGIPKAVEFYVLNDISDLSLYGFGSANNGGGTDGEEFTFPAVAATAGDYIYVATESTAFTSFFGFAPDYTNGSAPNINGDDAIELFMNGVVVDVFGDINIDGTGEPWDHVDGWAYRVSGTGPDGSTFVLANWTFSGTDALDFETTNAGAAVPFPIGTYGTPPPSSTDLLLTGVIDGPLTGGIPKAVEFYVLNDISDLSLYGFGSANNGGGTDGEEFTFPAVAATAGDYIYVATESTAFTSFFGFAPDYTNGSAPNINGDDAIELFMNGAVEDVFGDINLSGAGEPWDYLDGWASRVGGTGPDGSTFVLANWTFSGINALDGETTNAGAATPFPIGTYDAPPPPPEMCGDPITHFIYEIQGDGLVSPLVGAEVAIEAIVVGDFQNNAQPDSGNLNGFYLQEEDFEIDGDPATSDGIFVYAPGGMDVSVGDKVRVRGAVSEFSTTSGGVTSLMTEITASQIWQCGTGTLTPTVLSLPVTSVDAFEPYEGMLVTFPQDLYISEYFNFDRFNEIVLTSERHLTPTAEFEPGPAAIAAANAFLLDKITLDDGRTNQNPDPAIHPNGLDFDLTNLFRGGDTVSNVTGVVDDTFGLYRIQPTQGADYASVNPRTTTPDDVGGSLTVASFNVLNYFSTLDDGVNDICGPAQNQECRGADDAGEFTRQRDKIISAISAIDADVVGLLEIENNINDDAVIDLVNGLNAAYGSNVYDYVATGEIGTDAIKVALIYKPASVSLIGGYAILDSTVDSRFIDTKNRPTLAQTFMDSSTGGVFTVAVNHLKSKGSACDDVGDPDLGDGAGNCNLTRKAAAEALVDWLAGDPTGSGDNDFLIIGDLNSYDKEDPIDVILAAGYTDMAAYLLGEDAYSYVFDGQTGYLDYALASSSLVAQVTGVADWHINADEADLIDYDTSFKGPNQDAIYAPDAYRSSDHDPVIIGLDVCDEIAPIFDSVSVSPDELWPANHKYVNVTATVVVSDNFDANPTVELVSITSNEPDDGLGDGDTANDIVIVDDFHFKLRAERSGGGNGRVYTITYKVTDACGNSAITTVTVTVPKSKGK